MKKRWRSCFFAAKKEELLALLFEAEKNVFDLKLCYHSSKYWYW